MKRSIVRLWLAVELRLLSVAPLCPLFLQEYSVLFLLDFLGSSRVTRENDETNLTSILLLLDYPMIPNHCTFSSQQAVHPAVNLDKVRVH